jgi:hypothetical protein
MVGDDVEEEFSVGHPVEEFFIELWEPCRGAHPKNNLFSNHKSFRTIFPDKKLD